MSSIAATVPTAQVTSGRRAIKLAALLAAGAAVFGGTLLVREATTTPHPGSSAVKTSGRLTMPKSAELEQKWGIQFNSVTLLAATGVIDVRYTVFDVSKAQALHTNGRTGLPQIITRHGTVQPDSVMFHFHSKATEEAGQGYDIVYGNAEGRARAGETVTLVMPDGLKLAGVPVGE